MKKIVLLVFISCEIVSQAQTKLISHKSHSGSTVNFNKSLEKNLFNIGNSNFGMAPERLVRNSRLDTVILLSERKAVIVTSEHCSFVRDDRGNNNSHLWSAGKDTVVDHDVFNSKKSIDEIKKILKNEYFFANPIESIVFLGFDKEFKPEVGELNVGDNIPVIQEDLNDDDDERVKKTKRSRQNPFLSSIFWSLLTLFLRGSL